MGGGILKHTSQTTGSSLPTRHRKTKSLDYKASTKSVRYGAIQILHGNNTRSSFEGDFYSYYNKAAITMTTVDSSGQTIPVVITEPKRGDYSRGAEPELSPDEEDYGEPCSWGPIRPSWCQVFRSPKVVLFWFCWAGAIQVSEPSNYKIMLTLRPQERPGNNAYHSSSAS